MATDSRSGRGPSGPRNGPDLRPADDEDPSPRIRPAVAILLGVETLLLVSAALYTFTMVAGGEFHTRFGIGLGIFLLVFAAGVGLAARSTLVKGRFGLGYGITWQLFQALVGASMLRGGLYVPGVIALVLAIAAFVLLTRLVRSTPLPHRDG